MFNEINLCCGLTEAFYSLIGGVALRLPEIKMVFFFWLSSPISELDNYSGKRETIEERRISKAMREY